MDHWRIGEREFVLIWEFAQIWARIRCRAVGPPDDDWECGSWSYERPRGTLGAAAGEQIERLFLRMKESQDRDLSGALDQIREAQLRRIIDTIPAFVSAFLPDGSNEFMNQRWHDYTGLSPEESQHGGWQQPVHPDDLPPLMER